MRVAIRELWKRRRRASRRGGADPRGEPPPEQRILLRALQDLAGTARGVVYDVPRAQRPWPQPLSPIYVEGSSAWRRYLRARRSLDDGQLTLLLSLRQLPEEECRLAVDWGAAYANSFLLVEPRVAACDLSDPGSSVAREVLALCRQAAASESRAPGVEANERWTAHTPLGERLRELYGRWVCWDAPLPEGRTEVTPLRLTGPADTLSIQLLPLLYERFPQQSFDVALAELQQRERELFGGTVANARSAFRTRLGLPILHDPHAPDRAVRRLVNLGRMSVASGLPGGRIFGPGRRVPDDMPEDEFERLQMT